MLSQVLAFNPHHPEAHALQAVIHHLKNDLAAEEASRAAALEFSKTNAGIDHLIGRKLSAKYRFEEGARYQRRALETDGTFEPARIQLAQDLLRLGIEAEGWELAKVAHDNDGYNTTVFNLLQLRKSMDRYETLTSPHFIVRMEKDEARLYGQRVIDLLEEVWISQSERYGYAPTSRWLLRFFRVRMTLPFGRLECRMWQAFWGSVSVRSLPPIVRRLGGIRQPAGKRFCGMNSVM